MMRTRQRTTGALIAAILTACGGGGDGGTGPGPTLCESPTPVTLAVGEYRILDARDEAGCISLAGGASAREYVVMAYSGLGTETPEGVSEAYALQTSVSSAAAQASFSPIPDENIPVTRLFASSTAADFHTRLRRMDMALSRSPATHLAREWSAPAALRLPPNIGDKDSFFVCRNLQCNGFDKVGATVRYVGNPGIIYLDDNLLPGADELNQADFDQFGALFDNFLYPADTVAFSRESDINNDQHIAILMTPGVNALTEDCTNGRVIGYTFGNDLVPLNPGSNRREMFYTFVPKPATGTCTQVTRSRVLTSLPPVLIHELQHMISFNQHVLLRGGSDQDLWLNEGLSHFAEELGSIVIPDAQCPNASSCFSQFADNDVRNSYDYLENTEGVFVIAPTNNGGTLAERGAAWMFLRWMADQFATTPTKGTDFTRAIEMSIQTGSDRLAAIAGINFATLLGEWHLANYVDDLPGFPQVGRLNYKTWGFRGVFARNSPLIFEKPFPLIPDSTSGNYTHSGTLRQGSGRHIRVQLPAGSGGVSLRLAQSTTGAVFSNFILPRIAVVRIK